MYLCTLRDEEQELCGCGRRTDVIVVYEQFSRGVLVQTPSESVRTCDFLNARATCGLCPIFFLPVRAMVLLTVSMDRNAAAATTVSLPSEVKTAWMGLTKVVFGLGGGVRKGMRLLAESGWVSSAELNSVGVGSRVLEPLVHSGLLSAVDRVLADVGKTVSADGGGGGMSLGAVGRGSSGRSSAEKGVAVPRATFLGMPIKVLPFTPRASPPPSTPTVVKRQSRGAGAEGVRSAVRGAAGPACVLPRESPVTVRVRGYELNVSVLCMVACWVHRLTEHLVASRGDYATYPLNEEECLDLCIPMPMPGCVALLKHLRGNGVAPQQVLERMADECLCTLFKYTLRAATQTFLRRSELSEWDRKHSELSAKQVVEVVDARLSVCRAQSVQLLAPVPVPTPEVAKATTTDEDDDEWETVYF